MRQEEQGKKTSPTGKLPAGKDDKVIPAKPTALADEDLDKVAGGGTIGGMLQPTSTLNIPTAGYYTAPTKTK